MSEQYSLNFGTPEKQKASEPSGETIDIEELKRIYKEKVGVSPRIERDDRAHLIWAIQNPDEERGTLRKIDTAGTAT